MGFDVGDFLENLFADGPAGAPAVGNAAGPGAIGQPEAADAFHLDGDAELRARFASWVRRPDHRGRMGWEPADLPEGQRWWARGDFDSLPPPGPACPTCGSLEEWQDALGRQRCGVCERAALDKAIQLTELAARLRTQAQSRAPAPRIAPGCVAAVPVDALDLGEQRPSQGRLRGLCGA
jgi:ferredoxin